MSQNSLEITVSNLEHQIMRNEQQLSKNPQNAELMHRTTGLYRDLACGKIVLSANKTAYRQALQAAVALYENMQSIHQKTPLDPYYLTRGQAEPFFYAMAIDDRQAAARMAKRMPAKASPRMECEEDFDYLRVLEILLQPTIEKTVLEAAMTSFEASAGDESNRYQVIAAILNKDQDAFDEAFEALIQERVNYFDARKEPGSLDPYVEQTSAHLFIEGIGLLKLARQFGISLNRYRYIPDYLV